MAQLRGTLRPVCLLLLTGMLIPGWIHFKSEPAAADAPGLIQRAAPATYQPSPELPQGTWPAGSTDEVPQYPTVCSGAPFFLFIPCSAAGSFESRSAARTAQTVLAGREALTPKPIPATIPARYVLPLYAGLPLIPMLTSAGCAPSTGLLRAVVLSGGPYYEPVFSPVLQAGATFTSTATSSATVTPAYTATFAATETSSPTATATENEYPIDTHTSTPTTAPSVTPTLTIAVPSPTTSGTPTLTATATITAPVPPPETGPHIRINEIAWAGTIASSYDEWIELFNPGDQAVSLDGWVLSDENDLEIRLTGSIPATGFFLLERTDDSTLSLTASQIYRGTLNNSGESLTLTNQDGTLIDSANHSGGTWPAGSAFSRASMERLCRGDTPACWQTCSSVSTSAVDTDGDGVPGTPMEPNSTPIPVPTPTTTLTPSLTPTPTQSPTPTVTPGTVTPAPPLAVIINEAAWSGTISSSSDEWIELHCPGQEAINLSGWTLSDGNDIHIALEGVLQPGEYFLLERTDDSTISSILADMIYPGTLSNLGEELTLRDPFGGVIDTAGTPGNRWPAGDSSPRASMERLGTTGNPRRWGSFPGYGGNGLDADGNPIQGTPRRPNAVLLPTPDPAWAPRCVVINEVLMKPKHDWEGTGGVSTNDEFIELYNACDIPVFLKGWYLDDLQDAGSRPFRIPGITLRPGSFAVFFRSQTHITLNDNGDDVRLLGPDMQQVNRIAYLKVKAYNLSYGRLPDGSSRRLYGLWPTPGEPNILYVEPVPEPIIPVSAVCSLRELYSFRLPRLGHSPAAERLLLDLGLSTCPAARMPWP